MTDPILSIRDLRKAFDGLRVTDHVSLEIERGELHALIGPNGAGKTTLIAQIAGQLRPDGGALWFNGTEITHMSVAQRARLGLGRTFQITRTFDSFTVAGNICNAVQARERHSFRFWRPVDRIARFREAAVRQLDDVGLAARADAPAAALAHGERKQLELAMAMAAGPKLLLLDEPMAGLGPEESQGMVALLESLKGGHTILLVEHDMDAVFRLADRVSVLAFGRLIATGAPERVRNDPEVRQAYLGEEAL